MDNAHAHWGLAYYADSSAARAKRWYYVARVVKVDGRWFELYRSPVVGSSDKAQVKAAAVDAGHELLPGLFCPALPPRIGAEMVWDGEAA